MHISEYVSIAWMSFFIVFAVVVFMFADRKRNKAWIERMGAYIFAAIICTTLFGSMAPEFLAGMLNIPWYDGSTINKAVFICGMIIAWSIFAWGVEWLAGLAVVSLLTGGLLWIVTHLMI
ncbi:MAG: hypothetical protein COW18_10330 [Zetaproteobacteria bacterium CG12_big_fil_rev_8_21_14_0_65_54_13]|nr:MAG: hypothetical protein COX55_06470 [Zetaproteobacteria bacterium CG23_combo_of_CG06-09_8_20_14_all_54_7]PIW46764.1 MAG: hypothetical protein COW18_10330 [Zetaproteobacteria bacterium CG12_big_fil_rev_8_21_14_0_65_54_13]PIX53446.1 MAG: hypothetical protein COZ50_13250 [Zetaproteobacteria bacterium CG_4_10_14_3_um_filter_54_28]PJA29175.1 MAG: hypothetical protein CO188_07205 [Zetaproteobacteria bacterium CG_4_9_14_3_um_filter_54_145]